jgi:hypothetical protein
MNHYNEDFKNETLKMALDMLENAHDSLGIRSALKEAGSRNGIAYGPDMQAFVEWAEKKMCIDMSINEDYEYEKEGGFDHMSI